MLNDIVKKALSLKKEYQTIYRLIKDNDIFVMYYDLKGVDKALTQNIEGIDTIIIDNNLDDYEKEFILAHEVAHIILHTNCIRGFGAINNNIYKFELQANIFATIFCDYEYSEFNSSNYIQKIVNYIYTNHLKFLQ